MMFDPSLKYWRFIYNYILNFPKQVFENSERQYEEKFETQANEIDKLKIKMSILQELNTKKVETKEIVKFILESIFGLKIVLIIVLCNFSILMIVNPRLKIK